MLGNRYRFAWTNIQSDGARLGSPSDCNNWQSNADIIEGQVGLVTGTNHTWTDASPVSCQNHAPLYGFQQS